MINISTLIIYLTNVFEKCVWKRDPKNQLGTLITRRQRQRLTNTKSATSKGILSFANNKPSSDLNYPLKLTLIMPAHGQSTLSRQARIFPEEQRELFLNRDGHYK